MQQRQPAPLAARGTNTDAPAAKQSSSAAAAMTAARAEEAARAVREATGAFPYNT